METFRAYPTPKAKKQRIADADSDEELVASLDSGLDDNADEDKEVRPGWAKKTQKAILIKKRNISNPIGETIEDLKSDMNNIRPETGLARAEAEEAINQAGFAHGAAEEGANLASELTKNGQRA